MTVSPTDGGYSCPICSCNQPITGHLPQCIVMRFTTGPKPCRSTICDPRRAVSADRVIVMNRGRLVADRTPRDVVTVERIANVLADEASISDSDLGPIPILRGPPVN